MKNKKIHITEDSFVESNLKHSNLDIDCILKTYGSRGVLVDIFKISKETNITFQECFSVMQGKTVCIGEEWNFKEMKIDNWKYIFNPNEKYTTYILNQFIETDPKLLIKQHVDYLKFLKDETIKLTVSKKFKFNGSNTNEFYNKQNARTEEEIKLLETIDHNSITNCYSNEEVWHWNIWMIETEDEFIMYEQNVCD